MGRPRGTAHPRVASTPVSPERAAYDRDLAAAYDAIEAKYNLDGWEGDGDADLMPPEAQAELYRAQQEVKRRHGIPG